MTHRIHAFWDWFVRNIRELEVNAAGGHWVGAELLTRLQRIHPGMTYELGFMAGSGFHLIVSADGRRELFSTVHRIVDAAPPLDGWAFTALRPRRELPLRLGIGPFDVDSDTVWFSAETNAGLVDLRLCFPAIVDDRMIYAVAFVLLDAALGEYDTETKIGRITCAEAPSDPAGSGLIPFKELPQFVDALSVGVV